MISWLFVFQLPNFLLKFEYCKDKKSSLGEKKDLFFFKGFILVKFKNNRRKKLSI